MVKTICQGVRINCRTVGEGSDVVLIHGLAANHAFWRFDVLMTLAKEHRVTVYDLRGHGYSDMPPSGYKPADMAEDLHCLLDSLNIEQAHIVGHSFGGGIGLHYAAEHPERVSSVVLADSRIRSLQPTNYPRSWPKYERVKKILQDLGLSVPEHEPESGLWLLEQLASPACQRLRHKLEGTALSIPFGGWNGGKRTADRWLELLDTTTARQDFISSDLAVENLAALRQPLLTMCGEHSSSMPSFLGLRELLPSGKFVIIPDAGHFYPLTRPQLFVNIVSEFLRELRR